MHKILLFVVSVIFCYKANSQTIDQRLISSSQKTVISDEFSYSWSIGETIIYSNDATVSPGYHSESTVTISPISSNKDKDDLYSIIYYPNPTNRYLNIYISWPLFTDYSITMYDLKGTKYIPAVNVKEDVIILDFNQFQTGMYYLNIIEKSTNITMKQFKVIKI